MEAHLLGKAADVDLEGRCLTTQSAERRLP
jgi:hypothetical protein